MVALVYIAAPIEPPLSTSGFVCGCCLRLVLCRRAGGAWRCDDCAQAGINPERAQAERQARARLIPPKLIKAVVPPPKPQRERFKRRGKPPIFFTVEDAQVYERWRLAHPLPAVERKPHREPGFVEPVVADECGLFYEADDD